MAKAASFTCSNCGAVHSKWSGRCDDCGAWNTITEDVPLGTGPKGKGLGGARGKTIPLSNLSAEEAPRPRSLSGLSELDRQDIQLGRDALVDMLAAYKKIKPHKITVVFDGAAVLDPSRCRDRIKGVLIKFSRAGESADAVIVRMAAHEKERALIVSSDQEIINAASACRSATMTSPDFAERMLMAAPGNNDSEDKDRGYGRRSASTKKKGPRRRLSRRQRRNRAKMSKL